MESEILFSERNISLDGLIGKALSQIKGNAAKCLTFRVAKKFTRKGVRMRKGGPGFGSHQSNLVPDKKENIRNVEVLSQ